MNGKSCKMMVFAFFENSTLNNSSNIYNARIHNAQELLALVCVLSLGLTWYCVKTMVKQNASAALALVEIAAKMRVMKCIRELEGRE